MAKHIIFVKPVTREEIEAGWGFTYPCRKRDIGEQLYVRCNKDGLFNWKTSYVWAHWELLEHKQKGRIVAIML